MIAWLAVVLGINSTRNAGNFTRLHLVKITSCIIVLLIPNTTADHAIIYTYSVIGQAKRAPHIHVSLRFWYINMYIRKCGSTLCRIDRYSTDANTNVYEGGSGNFKYFFFLFFPQMKKQV